MKGLRSNVCSGYCESMFSAVLDELFGMSDTELVARIEANELERRQLDAETSAALAVAKSRSVHAVDGHRTMAAFCRARLNWSTTEAHRRLGAARAVEALEGVGDAWSEGRIGWSQATRLSVANANPRVRDQLPAFVPQLLQHAEQMPYRDFAAVVDHVVERADTDGTHDDRDAAFDGRRARVVGVGGTLDIQASGGDALTAAEMIEIHKRFVDIEYRSDLHAGRLAHGDDTDGHPLPRTDRQRRFDALVAIFLTAADATETGAPSEPLVNVVVDAHTWGTMLLDSGLSTDTDVHGRRVDPFTGLTCDDSATVVDELANAGRGRMCETTNGVPLHPHDVLRAALAGHVRRAVVDSDRVVIDLGRRQRLFTGSARQAAKLLVRRCEHAGCELPADWCDVDHDTEWSRDHGATDQTNATVLCRTHNNHKHRHRWRTRRGRNGTSYTIRADGTIILPIGARPPDLVDDCDLDADDRDLDAPESPEEIARITAFIRRRLDHDVRSRRPASDPAIQAV